jgi:hypothetical protein
MNLCTVKSLSIFLELISQFEFDFPKSDKPITYPIMELLTDLKEIRWRMIHLGRVGEPFTLGVRASRTGMELKTAAGGQDENK